MRRPGRRLTVCGAMLAVVVFALAIRSLLAYHEWRTSNGWVEYRSVEAAYENARLTREVAQIAVMEYEAGIDIQDLKTINGEIALAEADKKRAEERLAWTRQRMREKGNLTPTDEAADRHAPVNAASTVEQVCTLRTVLAGQRRKTLDELQAELARAQADEAAKKAECRRIKAALFLSWLFR
jgi:HlyD family secretion protein